MSTYPTKRDAWLLAVVWAAGAALVFAFFAILQEPADPPMRTVALVIMAGCTLLMAGLAVLPYYTTYLLASGSLTIRVGPLRKRIELDEITEVFPTRNPLSSPAWSLDRLHVRYESARFGVLISPQRKQQFLEELSRLAPHLELRGDRLVRRDV